MFPPFEYLFVLPDTADAAAYRAAMTGPHEAFVAQTRDFWLAGGPTFSSDPTTTAAGTNPTSTSTSAAATSAPQSVDPETNISGSWVLIGAASEDEAIGLLARDPFTVGGVWDFGKRMMWRVRSGLRVGFVKESVGKAMEVEHREERGMRAVDE